MVPRETSYFCFPSSPDVSLDFVSGNIRTLGKTKLTVSLGTIHQVYIVNFTLIELSYGIKSMQHCMIYILFHSAHITVNFPCFFS